MIKSVLLYLRYLYRHKKAVYKAGRILRVSRWQLLVHDLSKFLPAEFFPYAKRFYGTGDNELEYTYAWNLHQKRNPHHWQYFVIVFDDGAVRALEMPDKYAREMVADWAGAGYAVSGSWEIKPWYYSKKQKIRLHRKTRRRVETFIEELEASFAPTRA